MSTSFLGTTSTRQAIIPSIARRLDDQDFLTYLLISILNSLILAELLHRTVEVPWMKFRDRGNSKVCPSQRDAPDSQPFSFTWLRMH
ncbi:MAG: hypothetical protein NTW52_00280 [Planctomycetota bacterium]|nr:hypothetical protein [Planctomycetota bacterium]